MYRKSSYFLLMALAELSSSVATSGEMGPTSEASAHYVVTLGAGPAWESGGKTQTFYLAPEIEKTYAAKKLTHTLGEGELFLGLQKPLCNQLQGQFGIIVATTSSAHLRGNIWDDADPQFNNYTYSYQVRQTRVALKGKLLVDRGYVVIPWLSGSLGVGFNKAHRFNNTPTIFEAIKNRNFTSNTKTAFTYTVGMGVQKALTNNWQLGIGYEFADWGKSQLGRAAEQTLNSGLALSHLYTNSILLSITYIT